MYFCIFITMFFRKCLQKNCPKWFLHHAPKNTQNALFLNLGFCLGKPREFSEKIMKMLLPTDILSTFWKWTNFWKKNCPKLKMLCIYAQNCCDWSVRAFLRFFPKMRAFSRKKHFWVIYTFGFRKMIIFEKNRISKKKVIIFYTFFSILEINSQQITYYRYGL